MGFWLLWNIGVRKGPIENESACSVKLLLSTLCLIWLRGSCARSCGLSAALFEFGVRRMRGSPGDFIQFLISGNKTTILLFVSLSH